MGPGLTPRFGIQVGRRLIRSGTLLGNHQAANLEQLISLLAGDLIGVLNRFDLAIRGRRCSLQTFQLASIRHHICLLLSEPLEQSLVCLLLRD
ncbi:hypothetical protein D9M69_619050 [compost metagenome]